MNGAVRKRCGERLVDAAVLLDEGEPRQRRRGDDHLEVVAAAGTVLDVELVCVRKGLAEEALEPFGAHRAQGTYLVRVNFGAASPKKGLVFVRVSP